MSGHPAGATLKPRIQRYLLVMFDEAGAEVWRRAEQGYSPMGCLVQITETYPGLDISECSLPAQQVVSPQVAAQIRAIIDRCLDSETASRQTALEAINALLQGRQP